ncbi:uncharacterized protein V6R79_002837 [Siganus canaliculatus]
MEREAVTGGVHTVSVLACGSARLGVFTHLSREGGRKAMGECEEGSDQRGLSHCVEVAQHLAPTYRSWSLRWGHESPDEHWKEKQLITLFGLDELSRVLILTKVMGNKSLSVLASCVGQLLEALCHETSSDGWISALIRLIESQQRALFAGWLDGSVGGLGYVALQLSGELRQLRSCKVARTDGIRSEQLHLQWSDK